MPRSFRWRIESAVPNLQIRASMPSPAKQFFMGGPCEDLGYLNTRDHPRGAEHKVFVEELWRRFRPYADSHFREKARHEFHQRFWEMYLGVSLLEHGFVLQPHRDEGPDLCTCTAEGTRVWFEAVAPGPGSGHDQVPPVPRSDLGEDVAEVPTEKILLRFTNALSKKQEKYGAALAKGIIRPDDGYVLAINSRGIRLVPFDGPMPLFVRAFLPYGPLQVAFDSKTRQIVDRFYQYRPAISKLSGRSVSTRTLKLRFVPQSSIQVSTARTTRPRWAEISAFSTIRVHAIIWTPQCSTGARSS